MGCRAVVPVMRDQQYGRIVNVLASIAHGRTGLVGTAGARLVYAAAKSGTLGLTAQLAKEAGAFDITVNAVLPWLTFGDQGSRIRSKFEALDSETRDRILSNAPLGRAAADEVAATIAFLASENASCISVQGLPVDGCLSLVLPISTSVFALRPLRLILVSPFGRLILTGKNANGE